MKFFIIKNIVFNILARIWFLLVSLFENNNLFIPKGIYNKTEGYI